MGERRNLKRQSLEKLQQNLEQAEHQIEVEERRLNLARQQMKVAKRKARNHSLIVRGAEVEKAFPETSRLETGVISLEKKKQPIYDTLAAALGGILLNAEKKDIRVSVSCPEALEISHDRKWTSEALFNILDNAVKYTPSGGSISVSVESWEMYLKIDITDTGKGISESSHGAIFKRFYREEDVHDIEGIGIGLYLAREIVTMQGGYIKVVSDVGKGSTFSIFLSHK